MENEVITEKTRRRSRHLPIDDSLHRQLPHRNRFRENVSSNSVRKRS